MELVHKDDPKQQILDDVGRLDSIEVLFQYVLLGKYIRPAGIETRGGIALPQQAVEDDRFQTKVGLVLKLGHTAFQDGDGVSFKGWKPSIGDWVAFRPSDGMTMQIGRHECRLVPDVHIKLRLSHPDAVY
jgi:co-chaperonin GroES (HSP10)